MFNIASTDKSCPTWHSPTCPAFSLLTSFVRSACCAAWNAAPPCGLTATHLGVAKRSEEKLCFYYWDSVCPYLYCIYQFWSYLYAQPIPTLHLEWLLYEALDCMVDWGKPWQLPLYRLWDPRVPSHLTMRDCMILELQVIALLRDMWVPHPLRFTYTYLHCFACSLISRSDYIIPNT